MTCGFRHCKGKHECLLKDTSPCPEYECSQTLMEVGRTRSRMTSYSRKGFVDVDALVGVDLGTTARKQSRQTAF